MQYQVIQAGDPVELTRLVQTQLNVGWRPQGGICSFIIHTRYQAGFEVNLLETWFCQALILGD